MVESQSGRRAAGELRIPGGSRGAVVRFRFDGQTVDACAGETVAAALLAAGHRILRTSPRSGQPRGAFCWMGVCQECTVVVDGLRRPACRVEVYEGMVVISGTVP